MLGKIKAAIDNSPGKPAKIAVNESAFQRLKKRCVLFAFPNLKPLWGYLWRFQMM